MTVGAFVELCAQARLEDVPAEQVRGRARGGAGVRARVVAEPVEVPWWYHRRSDRRTLVGPMPLPRTQSIGSGQCAVATGWSRSSPPFTLGSGRHAPEVPGSAIGCATGFAIGCATGFAGGGSRYGSTGLGSELHATIRLATRRRISRQTRARCGVFHETVMALAASTRSPVRCAAALCCAAQTCVARARSARAWLEPARSGPGGRQLEARSVRRRRHRPDLPGVRGARPGARVGR
jgi:hypothetical protein